MSKWPHLDNAPITEALIDIRVDLPDDVDMEVLKSLHDEIRSDYPKLKVRTRWSGRIDFSAGEAPQLEKPAGGPYGYMFMSDDDLRVVQVRKDGFTFSRLRPYESWECLREEAHGLWKLYLQVARPTRVKRTAVRYINRIPLPVPVDDLGAWFNTRPEIASGICEVLQGLLVRLVIPYDDVKATAIVTETIEKGSHTESLPIIFDIDVFRKQPMDVNSSAIWEGLEDLRRIKNDIFFRSLSRQTVDMFDPRWPEAGDDHGGD